MIDLRVVLFAMKSFPDENYRWTYNEKVKLLERAIKAEAEVAKMQELLKSVRAEITEYFPAGTLNFPRFSLMGRIAKIIDIALAELEVQP